MNSENRFSARRLTHNTKILSSSFTPRVNFWTPNQQENIVKHFYAVAAKLSVSNHDKHYQISFESPAVQLLHQLSFSYYFIDKIEMNFVEDF